MGNKRIPEMRFEGFSGEWEECKLSDIVKLFGGNAFSSSESSSFGIPWLKIANVGTDGVDWSTSSYLPDGFWTSYKDYRLYKGDYVMALTRPILNHTLKISIVDKNSLLNQRVAKLIFSTNAEYGYQLLQRRSVVDKIDNELAGTDPPNLGSGDLKRIEISITLNNDEQTQIGNFFKQLDNTIKLQQQELTTLKQTKRGFLQKMFPKEGESVPEIRFPGFNGDWKKLELGSYADILTGGTPKTQIKEYWEPKEIPWMSSGEVNKKRLTSTDNMISSLGLENSSARWVKEHSVLIALAGQGKTRGTVATNEIPLTTNQSIAAIVPNDELYYEFVLCNLEKRYLELRLISSGDGTRGGLNKKIISDIIIPTPSIEEQRSIGGFFKQLDDTIALHQQELEALQETKKAFLQKMFV